MFWLRLYPQAQSFVGQNPYLKKKKKKGLRSRLQNLEDKTLVHFTVASGPGLAPHMHLSMHSAKRVRELGKFKWKSDVLCYAWCVRQMFTEHRIHIIMVMCDYFAGCMSWETRQEFRWLQHPNFLPTLSMTTRGWGCPWYVSTHWLTAICNSQSPKFCSSW